MIEGLLYHAGGSLNLAGVATERYDDIRCVSRSWDLSPFHGTGQASLRLATTRPTGVRCRNIPRRPDRLLVRGCSLDEHVLDRALELWIYHGTVIVALTPLSIPFKATVRHLDSTAPSIGTGRD